MPSNLRFIAILLVAASAGGIVSLAVLERQDEARARTQAEAMTGGRVDAGRAAIGHYGCGACHRIDGVDGAWGRTGPSLEGVAVDALIAGRLANTPENLMLWMRDPQSVVPGTGMPHLGIDERDARDVAAYLYTRRPKPS